MSQTRFDCPACHAVVATRRRDHIAPVGNSRLLRVIDGRVLVECGTCGHRRWVPVPKRVLQSAAEAKIDGRLAVSTR